ncbi:MAG: hypothetical protein C0501_03090 [Isosphaera sp.]|nr:hypothetical protein [Isosphaera sp.]
MSPRRAVTLLALAAAAIVIAGQVRALLADPTVWPPDDVIEYWAAAKLTLAGENPYDPARLLPLQQANGRDTADAVMMWNPPWALAVVLPLGLFPAREAQLLWLAVNLAAAGFCGDRLWRLCGGNPDRRWVGWAVVLAALPTAFALQAGQIGPLLLLGAVLFLDFERRGFYFAAGAATVLLAVKPHLAYLVWAAILCRAVATGNWRTVVGGAVAGLVCSAVPVLFDPHVWRQYLDALGNRPPAQWLSPTLGTVLRLGLGEGRFGLQFLPVAAGLAWFAWHWSRHRRDWDWGEQLPLLLLVSFVTAPYGAWPFDMVLLLPAAVRLVAGLERGRPGRATDGTPSAPDDPGSRRPPVRGAAGTAALQGLVAVNAGCLALNLLKVSSFWFLWVSPAVLLLYAAGTREPQPRPEAA